MIRTQMCRRLGLVALMLCVGASGAANPALTLSSVLNWPPQAHGAGGFSGLEVYDGGTRFVAISDRGLLVEGRLLRTQGRLTEVESAAPLRLRDEDGAPLAKRRTDAEGLARRPDGGLYVAFEGDHRVWFYDTPRAAAALPRPEGFDDLRANTGVEALALDDRGRLYAIPERSGQLTRDFPVWRYAGNTWEHAFDLRRQGSFVPVGADFGPDGRLYVLERTFTGLGFRSRVRRFTVTETGLGDVETLLETSPLRHGNLEGLSVWRDSTGALLLTMIADDNYRSIQRTHFVEYRLAP